MRRCWSCSQRPGTAAAAPRCSLQGVGKAGLSRGSDRVASQPYQACRHPLGLGVWGECSTSQSLGTQLLRILPLTLTKRPWASRFSPTHILRLQTLGEPARNLQLLKGSPEMTLGSAKVPVRSCSCSFVLQRFEPHPRASALPPQPWGPEPLTSVQPTVLRNHLLVGRVTACLLGRAWWAKEGIGEWVRREGKNGE